MPALLILSRHAAAYRQLVEAAGLPGLSVVATSETTDAIARAPHSEIVLGEPLLVRDLLPALPRLRWVQATWAGVEALLAPSLRRDYQLTNARGVFGGLMSEYVFAYILGHERRLLARYAAQQAGRWDPTPPGSLRGKLLGLIGVGSIGAAIAGTAKHFGMRVKGWTRASEDCPHVDAYVHGRHPEAFAGDLDYLVCAAPSTPETRQLVDAALLAALPPRAVLLNPGRGDIIDEAALADALRRGHLAGAVLDVFQQEPLPPDHVFWRTPNLIITSHTAAISAPGDIAPIFIDNYRRFIAGAPLRCLVDFVRGY